MQGIAIKAHLTFFTLLFSSASYAISIDDSSINWNDTAAKNKLLANVPNWSTTDIISVFQEYLHPERHNLPIFINGSPVNYNALFIQAMWGPTANPFVKYPRPAKAFIFTQDSKTKKSFMAPIIQSYNSKIYYVYDRSQLQPISLNNWMRRVTSDCSPCTVRFNICNNYGAAGQDICEKNYEGEIYDYPEVTKQQIQMPSAAREEKQDWHEKAKILRPKNTPSGNSLDGSAPWNDILKRNALLQSVITWPNYQIVKSNFEKIRDLRYFQDETDPTFLRRITWLYPDDGCWTRAAAVIKDFFGPMNNIVNNFTRPSKIFVFGNLCLNTSNSPAGHVEWWYHFAPIVRDPQNNQSYVLDPSVDATTPMTVENWVAAISATTGPCATNKSTVDSFNICNGYGTSPFDQCGYSPQIDFENEIRSMLLQKFLRKLERDRQVELGRDPNKVLGDNPPWEDGKTI